MREPRRSWFDYFLVDCHDLTIFSQSAMGRKLSTAHNNDYYGSIDEHLGTFDQQIFHKLDS